MGLITTGSVCAVVCVITEVLLDVLINATQSDAACMWLSSGAKCTWRASWRLTCLSDGPPCQSLLWQCCPYHLRPFSSDRPEQWPLSFRWLSRPRWACWWMASWATLRGTLCGLLALGLRPSTCPNRPSCPQFIMLWLRGAHGEGGFQHVTRASTAHV